MPIESKKNHKNYFFFPNYIKLKVVKMTVLPGDGGSGFSLNHFEFPGNPIKNISQSFADS